MKIYGNKAGRIYRNEQPAPDAVCARCGKPAGKSYERVLCDSCKYLLAKGRPYVEKPAGTYRCHKCNLLKPERDFMDARGRRRVCCSECRQRAADASKKYKSRKRKEQTNGS